MRKIIAGILVLIMSVCMISNFNLVYASTVDDVFGDADEFINQGEQQQNGTGGINEEILGETSGFLYNLLLAIGIVVAVIVGSILGIKYMMGSVEEKAEYKQTLKPYLIGAIMLFGITNLLGIVQSIVLGF